MRLNDWKPPSSGSSSGDFFAFLSLILISLFWETLFSLNSRKKCRVCWVLNLLLFINFFFCYIRRLTLSSKIESQQKRTEVFKGILHSNGELFRRVEKCLNRITWVWNLKNNKCALIHSPIHSHSLPFSKINNSYLWIQLELLSRSLNSSLTQLSKRTVRWDVRPIKLSFLHICRLLATILIKNISRKYFFHILL